MVQFFKKGASTFFAVETDHKLSAEELEKLAWAFSGAKPLSATSVKGNFIGPRREMITPWSTNAVEITQNMGMSGISRIEQFQRVAQGEEPVYDRMLSRLYEGLNSKVFDVSRKPDDIVYIDDIHEYNLREGLALSADEEAYLAGLAKKLGRPLTDSEVFGFSQVNSEHCRHKIFNGTFIIDGEEKPLSLFKLIKKTSQENPNGLVSAYKDNVAFLEGPKVEQFYPVNPDRPDYFEPAGNPAYRRNRRLHDLLSPSERRPPLGTDDEPARMALPDSGRNPYQGIQRCLRLRQQVRAAPYLRLPADVRA